MRAIERASDVRTSYLAASGTSTVVVRNVPVEYLYRGELAQSTDAPLAYNGSAAPRLGDRIVNLKATGVPFGLRGTVVAMHSSTGYVEVGGWVQSFASGRFTYLHYFYLAYLLNVLSPSLSPLPLGRRLYSTRSL